jgi:hypothetical protein
MVLLAGKAARHTFGPRGYRERVDWAMEGHPPNLVSIIARVARARDSVPLKG